MKGTTSIRHLLSAAAVILVLSAMVYADQITIQANQGANVFLFQNVHPTEQTATDFRVTLLSLPPPAIGAGTGGTPFPDAHFEEGGALGGGFFRVVYDGGPGVPFGLIYAHSFPGWPVGTRFDVFFSYKIDGQIQLFGAKLVGQGSTATPQGQTTPTPEPTTMLLLGMGVVGVALRTRKKRKQRI